MWIRYIVLACLTGILGLSPVRAQMADQVEVEVGATTTSGATMPFWLHANTDGIVDPASSGGVLRGRVARSLRGRAGQTWAFGYGAEVVGRASSRESLFLSALYAEARYGILRARVGRKPETIGTVADSLTSGSMGTSRNATPIPKILLRTDGYVDVPFTNEWLEFKGRFEHGWLSDHRFVDGAFLHQKSLYLRGGDSASARVHTGLVHKAMWGGTDPDFGNIPQSFSEFTRVVRAGSGIDDAPSADSLFILGDHFGIIDFGTSVELDRFRAHAYHQVVFEDDNNLELENPKNGLTGIEVADTRSRWWVDRLLYEYVFTKSQNGEEAAFNGNGSNYFNHSIYKSGWTLYGRMAASPLLAPFSQGSSRVGIANNRVVGHHVGIGGNIGSLDYRTLVTYTRNFGTFRDRRRAENRGVDYRFDPPLEQTSVLVEARVPWPSVPRLEIKGAVGIDTGELREDTIGLELSLAYQFR